VISKNNNRVRLLLPPILTKVVIYNKLEKHKNTTMQVNSR